MTRNDTRKAVIILSSSGDEEYMRKLNRLTDEERKIIEGKVPVSLARADEIIRKVLDYHTLSDEKFLADAIRLIDENKESFTRLAEL